MPILFSFCQKRSQNDLLFSLDKRRKKRKTPPPSPPTFGNYSKSGRLKNFFRLCRFSFLENVKDISPANVSPVQCGDEGRSNKVIFFVRHRFYKHSGLQLQVSALVNWLEYPTPVREGLGLKPARVKL